MIINNKFNIEKYNNINSAVFALVWTKEKVLDIWCRNWDFWSALIKEKKNIVDGVDYLSEVLNNAKGRWYRQVYQKDFNKGYIRDISDKYDKIICADVLEHILCPDVLLRELQWNLTSNGEIIISIPNIWFLLYRLKHLLWMRDYEETGIMDKTHLKFYTLKTLKELILKSWYTITSLKWYAWKNPKFFRLHWLAKKFPTIFAIQFICTIVPNES